MDDQFLLRRADIYDINALSQLSQKTIRETFVEDFSIPYPENDLDTYFRSSASPESFAKKITDSKRAVWVIQDKRNGELVAYAVAGPCDDIPHPDVCSNQDGQLNALFVRRDHRNHGFGKQFMNLALPWLDEHYPGRPMWLTVWSGNFKAQKFYAYYDFNKVGEFDYPVGQWKDLEFIMKRQRPTL
ncbi:unnamed protein product [Rotaria sp. Silwood2]|nr:unnamed protein product [Rotaria sp. Silwood2]CAF2738464.1 unnamed protein product [Rotaria sp. Silwood2]CAF3155456.1 unnamed protein product [Rotaria sp. Silwood2]CAF4341744.1 unnamed protein product [Rotaria sp. Silwood2]CAF4427444.1 unnamed protein product [Rotaria sp. Silwood2]